MRGGPGGAGSQAAVALLLPALAPAGEREIRDRPRDATGTAGRYAGGGVRRGSGAGRRGGGGCRRPAPAPPAPAGGGFPRVAHVQLRGARAAAGGGGGGGGGRGVAAGRAVHLGAPFGQLPALPPLRWTGTAQRPHVSRQALDPQHRSRWGRGGARAQGPPPPHAGPRRRGLQRVGGGRGRAHGRRDTGLRAALHSRDRLRHAGAWRRCAALLLPPRPPVLPLRAGP